MRGSRLFTLLIVLFGISMCAGKYTKDPRQDEKKKKQKQKKKSKEEKKKKK